MNLSYRVRGADGQIYGPASLNDLLRWLQEGRLSPDQEVTRADLDYWAPAQAFEELNPQPVQQAAIAQPQLSVAPLQPIPQTAPTPRPVSIDPVDDVADPALAAQLQNGAAWFFWIAGLSVINSIAVWIGSSWGFVVGLGVTQIIDAIALEIGGAGPAIGLAIDLIVSGLFVVFGLMARKGFTSIFIIGMALYGLDGLLFLLVGDWFGLAFHVFVLFCLFKGLQAARSLKNS